MKIIHHIDADGHSAASVVYFECGFGGSDNIEFIPYNYGSGPIDLDPKNVTKGESVYIVDICMDAKIWELIQKLVNKGCPVVHIDHHASGINMWNNEIQKEISGWTPSKQGKLKSKYTHYFSTEYSGALLTWFWSCMNTSERKTPEATAIDIDGTRSHFILANNHGRTYMLPSVIRYIDDHDRWIHQFPETRPFITALGTMDTRPMAGIDEKSMDLWNSLIYSERSGSVDRLVEAGRQMMTYRDSMNRRLQNNAFECELRGVKMCAINTTTGNSDVFGDKYKQYDAVILFGFDGKAGEWKYSIYAHDDSPVDVSKIAKKYGGGGHVHAAGFRTKKLVIKKL